MRIRKRAIMFRLTEDEFDHFHELVKKTGYSQEAYLRSLINGVVPQERPPPDYHTMVKELNAIGANLNQIARKAHVLGVIDSSRYDAEVQKLNTAVERIDDAVRLPRRL